MDWMDIDKLARVATGVADGDVHQALDDQLGVSMEQFHRVVESVLPFTIPTTRTMAGRQYRGFVTNGSFICKELVTPSPDSNEGE